MPDASKLAKYFEKARANEGLTHEVLATPDAVELLGLEGVQVWAARHDLSDEQAAIEYCREVLGRLSFQDQLIIDVALNLNALAIPEHLGEGTNPSGFRSMGVMDRREYLTSHWDEIHKSLGKSPEDEPPKVYNLRMRTEPRALASFAQALDSPARDQPSIDLDSAEHDGRTKVVVVGAAVMDVIFRLPQGGLPQMDASVQVTSLDIQPGGKGLTQAVAAARLGMEVWLAAAVGADEFGNEIKRYLEKNGVHTSLITTVLGQQTPVTGVLAFQTAGSVALGWKNDQNVRLNPHDISTGRIHAQLQVSDFVFLTFEPPTSTINATIKAVAELRETGNSNLSLIVTPAPPLDHDGAIIPADTDAIDLLIANQWECQMLTPKKDGSHEAAPLEDLARELLGWGMKALCVPSEGQCFVFRSDQPLLAVSSWPVPVHDNTGERDALAAALAYQLSNHGRTLDHDVLGWATAAMAASSMRPGVASAMPTRAQVERVINTNRRPSSTE